MSGRVREVRGTIVLSHARAREREWRERGEDEVTPRLGWFRFGLETCLRGEERNSFAAVVGGNGTGREGPGETGHSEDCREMTPPRPHDAIYRRLRLCRCNAPHCMPLPCPPVPLAVGPVPFPLSSPSFRLRSLSLLFLSFSFRSPASSVPLRLLPRSPSFAEISCAAPYLCMS